MKVLKLATAILIATSGIAFAQTPMTDTNMSQAQKDQMARQTRPEIKNSESKPPTSITTGSAASGPNNNPTTQSLQNGGSGSGGGGAGGGSGSGR